jgi:hypothetical protein
MSQVSRGAIGAVAGAQHNLQACLGAQSLGSVVGEKRCQHATHNTSQDDATHTTDERCVDHTEEAGANRDEEEGVAEDRPSEQPQGTRRAPDHASQQTAHQDAQERRLKGWCLHQMPTISRAKRASGATARSTDGTKRNLTARSPALRL